MLMEAVVPGKSVGIPVPLGYSDVYVCSCNLIVLSAFIIEQLLVGNRELAFATSIRYGRGVYFHRILY